MTSKLLAELFGTFVLVFFGCGSAVLMGPQIGMSGIALTFGLTIVAAAYGIGAISGAHLNPAVSLGMLIAGRMTARACLGYAAAQILGAIAAAGLLYAVASGRSDFSLAADGLGQNGYGPGYLGGYSLASALLFETVATFVFVTVILGATAPRAPAAMAGLAIGLTLAMIHLTGITITGVSVNPARSIGPALWVGGTALAQLWVFLLAPLAGGALAGALHRAGLWQAAAA